MINITINDLLCLMSYVALDFSRDAFVQVIDYDTAAHYRQDGENLLLGGDPVHCSVAEFMNRPVKCLEFMDEKCYISV